MSEPFSTHRIGIDGGGTRCRFALATPEGRFEEVLGGANVHTDLDKSINVLRAGLAALADASGLEPDRFNEIPAYAGLAGVIDKRSACAIEEALDLTCLTVEDDRRSTVVGALGHVDGVVAGIGTGSFVGRQAAGSTRFTGGYGADLGDEASGCWLGRKLLSALLHSRDGLLEASPLINQTWTQYDGRLDQVLAIGKNAAPFEIADFAPRIVAAAEDGDAVGAALMREGAAYIEASMAALGRRAGEPVCLTGGLGKHYAAYLCADIAACVREPEGNALHGALLLAGTRSAPKQRVAS